VFTLREFFQLNVCMNAKDRFVYECEFSNLAQRAFEWFRIREIEPILIKGWLASQNYPKNHFRHYGDIDLIIPTDTPRSIANEVEHDFGDEVDLHFGLRNHDTLSYQELFRNSETKKLINGYEIRGACPEDHLRILAVHWLNDGGIAKNKLWDIYYAVSNRTKQFDWEKCLSVVSRDRRKWVLTAIALTNHYLELPINDLPFADEIREPGFVPNWIFQTIENEWQSKVTLSPLMGSFKSPKAFFQQIKKRLPPNPIQSAIETNTAFDNRSRLPSQVKAILKRMLPQDGNKASIATVIARKLSKFR
jgi:hypothetical protein